jgi:hypothetical protein
MRVKILITMATVLLLSLAVPHAYANQHGYACPLAFDLGGLTVEQALALPNIQAGLEAGEYTEEFVREFHVAGDRNGDGILCFQSFPSVASPSSLLQYYYNVVDNHASAPAG